MSHPQLSDKSSLVFCSFRLLCGEVLVHLVVLFDVVLEVCVHLVQEDVHLLEIRGCQLLDPLDPLVDHGRDLPSLVLCLLTDQVLLEKEDLDALDQLLVAQLEVLVARQHLEVRAQQVVQLPALVVAHYFREVVEPLRVLDTDSRLRDGGPDCGRWEGGHRCVLGSRRQEGRSEAGVGGPLSGPCLDALPLSALVEVAYFCVLLTSLNCANLTVVLHVLLNYGGGLVDGLQLLSILLLLCKIQLRPLMEVSHPLRDISCALVGEQVFVEKTVLIHLEGLQAVPLLDAERRHQRLIDQALGHQRQVVVHVVIESNTVIVVFLDSEFVADVGQLELLPGLHEYLQVCFVML